MTSATLGLRMVVSLGALVGLGWFLDAGDLLSRLRAMRPEWVLVALLISVVQIAVSAWRWRFTAARLGIELPFPHALREYYLATFLNQVLPGGIAGDASRAWRHARGRRRRQAEAGPAIRAVVLERASGQTMMLLAATASFVTLTATNDSSAWQVAGWASGLCGVVAVGILLFTVRPGQRASWTVLAPLIHDAQASLLARSALPAQLGSSAVVVGTYIVTFLVAARAVSVETPASTLLPLVAPVLVAMLLPVTVAGWGVREGAAALLWESVGLSVTDGVVISLAYGLLTLMSSLPGAFMLASASSRHPPSGR